MSAITGTEALSHPSGAHGAPLRLTRRGRVVLLALALLVSCLVVRAGTAAAEAGHAPQEVRVHVVQAGETLWGYAAALAAPGEDVRERVDQLQDLNGATTSDLQVGQTVLLPVVP